MGVIMHEFGSNYICPGNALFLVLFSVVERRRQELPRVKRVW